MTYTQLDSNTGVMKIYGHITEWWNSAEEFTETFEEMERKFQNIHIRLHCFGGSVFEGTVIFNAIAKSKATVTGIVEGIAASMGSVILQACHKRIIADNAFVMVHRPTGYTQGDSDAHFNTGKLLRSMENNFTKTYARRSGRPENEVKKYLDGKDNWFSADEAKDAGLIDEITEPVVTNLPAPEKPDAKGDIKSIYSRYAAQLLPQSPQSTISKTNTSMKKELIARFSLKGVDENTADAAFVEALGKRFDELIQANQKLVADQIESVIAAAETVKGQPFDAKIRTTLATIGMTSGLEALMVTLGVTASTTAPAAATTTNGPAPVGSAAAAPAATPRVVNLLNNGNGAPAGDNTRASWTWDDFQEKDPSALEEMEKSNKEAFNALYKAKYKTDPA